MTTNQLEKFIKNYGKYETVFKENTSGKEMYIIYSGKIKLYKEQAPGKNMLLAILDAGNFFGEMALVDDSPRSATAIADEEDTQLIVLDESKFLYLLRQQPQFALAIMWRLAQRLREADQALARLGKRPKKRK